MTLSPVVAATLATLLMASSSTELPERSSSLDSRLPYKHRNSKSSHLLPVNPGQERLLPIHFNIGETESDLTREGVKSALTPSGPPPFKDPFAQESGSFLPVNSHIGELSVSTRHIDKQNN